MGASPGYGKLKGRGPAHRAETRRLRALCAYASWYAEAGCHSYGGIALSTQLVEYEVRSVLGTRP